MKKRIKNAAAADTRDQTKGHGSLCVGLDVSLATTKRCWEDDSVCVCVTYSRAKEENERIRKRNLREKPIPVRAQCVILFP